MYAAVATHDIPASSIDEPVRYQSAPPSTQEEDLYTAICRVNGEHSVYLWAKRAAGFSDSFTDAYFEDAQQEARIKMMAAKVAIGSTGGQIVTYAKMVCKQCFMEVRAVLGSPVSIPKNERGRAKLACETLDAFTEQAMGEEDPDLVGLYEIFDDRQVVTNGQLERLSDDEFNEGMSRLNLTGEALQALCREVVSGESFDSANDKLGYGKDTLRRYRKRIEDALEDAND